MHGTKGEMPRVSSVGSHSLLVVHHKEPSMISSYMPLNDLTNNTNTVGLPE